MKSKFICLVLTLFSFSVFLPSVVLAQTNSQKIITLKENEVVEKDYFAASDVVEIYGSVMGDVYIAGGMVTVNGNIEGDVLAAGGTIVIAGKIEQDVRVAGGDVTISGNIKGNVTVGGGTVDITDNAVIDGSVVAGAGTININAPIGKNIKIGAGNFYLANSVGGDSEVGAETIRLAPKASVDGDFNYWSEQEANVAEEASVSGQIVRRQANVPSEQEIISAQQGLKGLWSGAVTTIKIVSLLSFIVVGLILAKLFPKYIKRNSKVINNNPWKSILWGLVGVVITPLVLILLAITVIGLPLSGIILALYLVVLYLGKFFAMVWVGEKLLPRFTSRITVYTAFFTGLLIATLLSFIPIIGFFSKLWFTLTGVGTLILTIKEVYNPQSKN